MSKYNKVVSIPIKNLSKDEIATAIKEWAEGNPSLEELLWACYNNGIETNGCHSYKNDFYVGIYYEDNKRDLLLKLMNVTLTMKQVQVLVNPDGGNIFSGPNWYKTNILLGSFPRDVVPDDTVDPLKTLTNVFNSNTEYSTLIDTTPLLRAINFFKDKLTSLKFRIVHSLDDTYYFSVEKATNEGSDIYNYLCYNLLPLGFKIHSIEDTNHKEWYYSSKNLEEFNKKLEEAINRLIDNFTLKIPSTVEEADSLNAKAHIVRNNASSDEEVEEWIMEQRKKIFPQSYSK